MHVVAITLALLVLGGLVLHFRRGTRRGERGSRDPSGPSPHGEMGPRVTVGDVIVDARYQRDLGGSWNTALAATCPGLPTNLRLTPQGLTAKGGEIVVLDTRFDGIADVRGDIVEITARLDAEVRRMVETLLVHDDGRVADGQVSRQFHDRLTGAALETAARRVAAIAAALARGGTAERLATNAVTEPSVEVRARNLALLLAHFPNHPKAQALTASAGPFEDPWIRILKASARGDLEDLRAAAKLLRGRTLGAGDLVVERAAVRRLGKTGEAEELLIACLDPLQLRLEAAVALAETGTLDAVAPLMRQTKVLRSGPKVRRAAQRAIAAIHARAGNVAPGRLSLAESGETGTLTLVDGEEQGEASREPAG